MFSILFGFNIALAGDSGHGADPLLISAKEYPQKTQLDRAIAHVDSMLSKLAYPQDFKDDISDEMHSVKSAKLYLSLPSIIVLKGAKIDGYASATDDLMQFLELGSFTYAELGQPVYFSERVYSYDPQQLADNVVHEISHHTLQLSLKSDEVFVRKLAASIVSGQYRPLLNLSLNYGVHVDQNYIGKTSFVKKIREAISDYPNETYDNAEDALSLAVHRALKQLPDNINDLSVYDVINAVSSQAEGRYSGSRERLNHELGKIILEANPNSPYVGIERHENYQRYFLRLCRGGRIWDCKNPVTFGELFRD